MTLKKRFIYGLLSLLLLIIVNSLLVINNNDDDISFFWMFISLIIYFVMSFVIIIWEKLVNKSFLFIFKIIVISFISIIFFTDFSFFSQEILFTLPLLVALLWSIPDIKSTEIIINNNSEVNKHKNTTEETVEKKSNIIFPYLINFITLFIVYVIASMCYYSMEVEKEGIWFPIFIMGIAMAFVYWLSYLCYRYLLKNTKTTKIFKIILVLGLLYWIYNYGRSIKEIPFYLLISVDIVAVISLTVQDLILKRNKKQQSFK